MWKHIVFFLGGNVLVQIMGTRGGKNADFPEIYFKIFF